MEGDHSAALIVFDCIETALRVGFGDFLDSTLNFGRHREKSSRVIVVGDGMKPTFMRDMYLFVVADRLVGLVVTQQIKQEIQLDLDTLRLRRFLNLKSRMIVALHMDAVFVDVKIHGFGVWMRMMVKMLSGCVGELLIRFHRLPSIVR
jgi:hypothetical protein